jgi:hypothetical protein
MLVLDLASLHLSSHANEFCLSDQAVCFAFCNDVQQADLLTMLSFFRNEAKALSFQLIKKRELSD